MQDQGEGVGAGWAGLFLTTSQVWSVPGCVGEER